MNISPRKRVICTAEAPVAQTKAGKLHGMIVDDVYTFRGVRYGTAKRFLPPEPVAEWEGVAEALHYGCVCPLPQETIPKFDYLYPHRWFPKDEDCLFLNVWSQHLDAAAKRPVMVWLHGGGFTDGSSTEQDAYDGAQLARDKDAVVVSLNHRLNCLGYLDMSAYGEQYRRSGIAGMEDIVLALRWVRDNIACFGGDPHNVTIFGQSGGGMKVLALMQMPSADGLYHKAIVQSGVIFDFAYEQDDDLPRRLTREMLKALSIPEGEADRLRTTPYETLVQASMTASKRLTGKEMFRWAPVADGEAYIGSALCVGFREETQHIPLLIGSVAGEMHHALPRGNMDALTEDAISAHLEAKYGDYAPSVRAAFAEAYPGKNPIYAVIADTVFRLPTIALAKRRAAFTDAGVYMYDLAYVNPVNGGKIAWHCSEIPYVFRNARYLDVCCCDPEAAEALEGAMSGAWVAFAENGDPNCAKLPPWPAYTEAAPYEMIFDTESGVALMHDTALLRALQESGVHPGGIKW